MNDIAMFFHLQNFIMTKGYGNRLNGTNPGLDGLHIFIQVIDILKYHGKPGRI
jgi:hypothetical protein